MEETPDRPELAPLNILRLLGAAAGLVAFLWLTFTPVAVVASDDRAFGGSCGYFWAQTGDKPGDPGGACVRAALDRLDRVLATFVGAAALFTLPLFGRSPNRVLMLVLLGLTLIAVRHAVDGRAPGDMLLSVYLLGAFGAALGREAGFRRGTEEPW